MTAPTTLPAAREHVPARNAHEHVPARSPATCSAAEVKRWTGMVPERLRTWERRHGFPRMPRGANGLRAFAFDDLPGILAAAQLIEHGLPVSDAIDVVRRGLPAPDLAVLERTFQGLDAPVVVVGGPEPLRVVWANPAARRLTDGGSALRLPDATAPAYRDMQRMLRSSAMATIAHDWTDERGERASIAWRLPAPAFVPPLVVMVQLDADELTVHPAHHDASERDLASWTTALAAARRALQRGVPHTALALSLAALVEACGVEDAVLMFSRDDELRAASTCRGQRVTARMPRAGWAELDEARSMLRPVRLGAAFAAELRLTGGALLALPLVAARREYGFAVLRLTTEDDLDDLVLELLMGWANAAATCHSNDLALHARRQALAG